jgi:hypothetical protein
MSIKATIEYYCPNEKGFGKFMGWVRRVPSTLLEIVGECSDDEYPANHRVLVSCACGEDHLLVLTGREPVVDLISVRV